MPRKEDIGLTLARLLPNQNPSNLLIREGQTVDEKATVKRIRELRDKLAEGMGTLPDGLQPDLTLKRRAIRRVSRFLPQQWARKITPSPLAMLETNLRDGYNGLARKIEEVHEMAEGRVARHNQLVEIVERVKEGAISWTDVANQMRKTVHEAPGTVRIPVVEKMMNEYLEKLPDHLIQEREAATQQDIEMMLRLTEPIVRASEAGLAMGYYKLDCMARAHYVVSEIREPHDKLWELAEDLADASLHTAQTPGVIKHQMDGLLTGLNLAADALELGHGLETGPGNMEFLKGLSTQALGLSDRMNHLLAPPSDSHA